MRSRPRPILGFVLGVAGGLFFLLLASVTILIRGPGVLDRLGVTYFDLLSLYLIGGAIGGTLLGLILPITVRREGAVVAGVVAALPLYLGAGMLLGHSDHISGTLAAVVVGGLVGYRSWEPPREASSEVDANLKKVRSSPSDSF